jgi:transposase
LLYADEASQSVYPKLSRTYAPKGQTPTITISTEITAKLFMASAIGFHGEMDFMIRNKPFDSAAIIEFLQQLLNTFNKKLIIIWDGASIHHSALIKDFLTKIPKDKLYLVQQPRYSPELNADEQVWAHLKNYKLKNTCNRNVKELFPKIDTALMDMKNDKALITSFFHHPNLSFL